MTTQDTTSPSGPIDGPRLQELRLNLGLSKPVLASRIGVSETTMTKLEVNNGAGTRLNVPQLARLAELLNAHPTELFKQPNHAPAPPDTPNEPSLQHDVQRLGAFLSQERRRKRIPTASVCASLGWTLDRFDDTATALTEQVVHVGMQLDRRNGTICITADTKTEFKADLSADIRRLDNHRSLDKAAAQIAWLIYNDNYTATRGIFPEPDRIVTDTLIKRGVVERDGLGFRCTPAFNAAFK